MDRQQILDLYTWQPGTCFRHPDRGTVDTVIVRTLHPRDDGHAPVRACRDCVLEMEEARRAAAEESGSEYEPGHVGEEPVRASRQVEGRSGVEIRGESGE